ncbi:hypothetical protein IAI18_11730 [Acetobacteraceae bacterium H6797]|nr:hypothetical protein [Acetobacteraceae bacterium H6797]
MKDMKVGLFFDGQKSDHSYTVFALRSALLKTNLVSECLEVTPYQEAGHIAFREALSASFMAFDGICLDLEFGRVPGCTSMLFALDGSLGLNAREWTEAELDHAAQIGRIVAFDLRPWSFFRGVLNREVALLPAPLPHFASIPITNRSRVVVIVNSKTLADHYLDGITQSIRAIRPNIEISVIQNLHTAPAPQSAWMDGNLLRADAHLHIGHPPEAISAGRLIDSMNMRAPCIVFDDALAQADSGIALPWRTPQYLNDINIVRSSSMASLGPVIKAVLLDKAWSQNLVRNATREVDAYQTQFQKLFVEPLMASRTSWREAN